MAADRNTKVTDALVRILRRLLTPATIPIDGLHDQFFRDVLLETAGHGDGHVLAVTVALLLAILTGRSDLCIAGVFGAGKTRSLAILLIASAVNSKISLQWCLLRRTLLQRRELIKSVTCGRRSRKVKARLMGRAWMSAVVIGIA